MYSGKPSLRPSGGAPNHMNVNKLVQLNYGGSFGQASYGGGLNAFWWNLVVKLRQGAEAEIN